MDGRSFSRVHWRLRGAWMWPLFVVFTAIDGILLHALPLVGDSATLPGALILAFIINLVVIVALGPTLGTLVRRRHRDMPRVVSSDYAGAAGVLIVTAAILAGGLVHHHVVTADRAAENEAVSVARDYIATRAPQAGSYDLHYLDVFEIEPPSRARVCAHDLSGEHWYCVAVTVPVGGQRIRGANFHGADVRYAGSESNELLSEGVN
jgi:uncharacterized membrane protein YhaH (DUF805 family)